jgi:hypothetical protein
MQMLAIRMEKPNEGDIFFNVKRRILSGKKSRTGSVQHFSATVGGSIFGLADKGFSGWSRMGLFLDYPVLSYYCNRIARCRTIGQTR